MPKIEANGIKLYYELAGNPNGPALVFVNGLLTDTTSWSRHLPYFTEQYRCLVYDCRGQGQSDKPDHVYDTALHTADLAALLEGLNIRRASFVGLSNGGAAVLDYAAGHRENVAALVVAGAYSHADAILRIKLMSWIKAMEAGGSPLRFDVATPWVWGGNFLEHNYEALLPFREKGTNMPVAWAMNLIKGALVHDIRDKLGTIEAPALVIVGEDDLLTPPKLSRSIVDQMPHAELRIMPGIGHAAALEDVEGFCSLVNSFLASNASTQAERDQ